MSHGWGLYSTRSYQDITKIQMGLLHILTPLSHVCTHAHKKPNVHVYTLFLTHFMFTHHTPYTLHSLTLSYTHMDNNMYDIFDLIEAKSNSLAPSCIPLTRWNSTEVYVLTHTLENGVPE